MNPIPLQEATDASPALWPHQQAAIKATLDAVAARRPRALLVMPTGTGKTRTFCEIARRIGGPVLVVVHRDELLRQAQATMQAVYPEATFEVLSGRGGGLQATVVFTTVQRLTRRLDDFPRDHFRLVIIDEAHHVPAASWTRVTQHFTPTLMLGCTATPERLDGKNLRDWFGEPVYVYPLKRAIEDGILVPLRQRAVFTKVSLDGLGSPKSDFSDQKLSPAVNTSARNTLVVDAYQRFAADRPTLVFAVDLAHVEQLRQSFDGAGVKAAVVTGEMEAEERQGILAGFSRGDHSVLISVEVLTEGYDERRIGCVIMARPTKSIARYQQCFGRGLRIDSESGKADCLVIDIRDRTNKHRLATASHLFGPEVLDCGGLDVREAVKVEQDRLKLEPLAPTPAKRARWAKGEDARWPRLPTLHDYDAASEMGLLSRPAPDYPVSKLKQRFGMEARRQLTRGELAHLIKKCEWFDRLYPTPATPKQKRTLQRWGLWVEGTSKRQAAGILSSHFG